MLSVESQADGFLVTVMLTALGVDHIVLQVFVDADPMWVGSNFGVAPIRQTVR